VKKHAYTLVSLGGLAHVQIDDQTRLLIMLPLADYVHGRNRFVGYCCHIGDVCTHDE